MCSLERSNPILSCYEAVMCPLESSNPMFPCYSVPLSVNRD